MMANLRVYYQNVRGLRTKTELFTRNLRLCNYDIISLTETWLLEDIVDCELFDSRYCVWRRDRNYAQTNQTRGGGVLIAVRKDLLTTYNHVWQSSAEDIWITITLKPKGNRGNSLKLNICTVYICKENCGNSFETQLGNFSIKLSEIIQSRPLEKFLVLGDFNVSSISWAPSSNGLRAYNVSGEYLLEFINNLNLCNLDQYNSVVNKYERILDLVLCNDYVIVSGCLDPLVPEDPYHSALCIKVSFVELAPMIPGKRMMYSYNKGDYDQIRLNLSQFCWTKLLNEGNLDTAVDLFYQLIYKLRDDFIPTRRTRSSCYPVWYTSALIKIIKEKSKYHKKFRIYGNLHDQQSFKILRERARQVESECYTKYIAQIEEGITNSPKAFWHFIKNKKCNGSYPSSMSYQGNETNDPRDICERFASYFQSTFLNSNSGESRYCDHDEVNGSDCHSIEINPKKVCALLNKLDLNKSAGPDLIPAVFLRSCAKELSIPISILFERSLREGVMPSRWKSAFITPIHKKGAKNIIENYRPISKLCLIAKVFERLVFNELSASLNQYLDPFQHGFVKNRSVTSNLLVFTDYITEKMESGNQVDAIYTDYTKAFDRIDHSLLLYKLSRAGIRGDLFRWFSSYVKNRSQAIVLNGYTSSWNTIPSGVPQGSLLGPLLFILFISDIGSCFRHSNYLLFADDMKIYRTVNTDADALLLQEDLDRLNVYCIANKLELNISKCNSISFCRKPHVNNYVYKLMNEPLTIVQQVKDLGVVLDTKLSFEYHIDAIVAKASKAMGFIMRMSGSFKTMKTIKILYCSYVRSHLEFASQIWNPDYEKYKSRIEKLQSKFTRFLSFKFKLNKISYEQRCKKFHLLPLYLRRHLADLILLVKVARGIIDCPLLLNKINLKVPILHLRNSLLLEVPFCHTRYRANSFLLRACTRFNQICNIPNIDLFWGNLDLIRKHFCNNLFTGA